MLRNFVHVEDLVSAILIALDHPAARQQTFNICMDEPVDYAKLGAHLEARGIPTVRMETTSSRTGWTTPRRSSCSAGDPSTNWPDW